MSHLAAHGKRNWRGMIVKAKPCYPDLRQRVQVEFRRKHTKEEIIKVLNRLNDEGGT